MLYRIAADCVLVLHLAFIAFVLLGAVAAARWRWLAFLHIPAAVWGFLIEFRGGICPLTYAENFLRVRGGEAGYSQGFIEHYLLAVIYPAGLTRGIQWGLAAVVVLVNVVAYGWLLVRRRAVQRSNRS
jgi:hypothetical protein